MQDNSASSYIGIQKFSFDMGRAEMFLVSCSSLLSSKIHTAFLRLSQHYAIGRASSLGLDLASAVQSWTRSFTTSEMSAERE